MRILILITTVLLCLALTKPDKNPEVNIVIAIAEKNGVCTSSDIGFSMLYGEMPVDKLVDKAVSRVKRSHPGLDDVRTNLNIYKKKKYLGNHVVIISGSSLHKNCLKGSYGIGFGKNQKEALALAIEDLKSQNKYWKGDYKIVRDKQITP